MSCKEIKVQADVSFGGGRGEFTRSFLHTDDSHEDEIYL